MTGAQIVYFPAIHTGKNYSETLFLNNLPMFLQYTPGREQMMEYLKDIWLFLKERKKWWLAPLIIVLLLVGLLIILGGGSALSPFIYSLF